MDEESLRSIDPIFVNDLRSPGDVATFAELEAWYFPVSAQANVCKHSYTDQLLTRRNNCRLESFSCRQRWSNVFTLIMVWAEECRGAQNVAIPNTVQLPQTISSDRMHLLNSKTPRPSFDGRLEDHSQYKILADPARQLEKILRQEGHVGQIFYFLEESLERLKPRYIY